MESKLKVLAILLFFGTASIIIPKQAAAQQSGVSFQVFYDQLSPYGQWINYSNYGYVWLPNAGSDFVPYSSAGHWIYTEYGWTWVSDYSWGWAPFHYGRWDFDNFYGWMWIPDNEWGPSWVTWRRGNGYYGWEPMGPGISISMSFGRSYNSHNDHWMFVRDRDIEQRNINHYYVNRTDHDRIIRDSRIINRTYVDDRRRSTYVSGPTREDVQRVTGRTINSVAIQDNERPGQNMSNGQLRMYRPEVRRNNDNERTPTPSSITNLRDVRRPTEGKAISQPREANPQDNNRREQQQPNVTNPQIPSDNNKREQQPSIANPQTQPSQPQRGNPDNINRREPQPIVQPQNNNNNRAQPTQPQRATPSNNDRREQQPNVVKPPQPQRANPAPANNNRREQQPNVAKPQNNRSEQPKESKPEQEKGRRE